MRQLTIFLLTIFSLSLFAEDEIISYRLSTVNGLPDNNIRTITVDKSGMLYFQALNTTYLFDGYDFRQLKEGQDVKKTKRDGDENARKWEKDNRGNIFKVSTQGIIEYKGKETFTLKIYDPEMLKLSKSVKVNVVTDCRGLVWIAVAGNGLFVYNLKDKTVRHITKDDPKKLLDSDYIVDIAEDKAGNVWVTQEHYGVVCLKVMQQNYHVLSFATDTERSRFAGSAFSAERSSLAGSPFSGEKSHNIRMLRRLKNGNILFCDNGGDFYAANGMMQNVRSLGHGINILTAFLDSNNHLWLGSRQNGIQYDGKWFGSGRIESFVEDNKHRVWACGLRNDVKVSSIDAKGELKTTSVIKGICPRLMIKDHQGNIVLASDSGLITFNPDNILKNRFAYSVLLKRKVRNVFEDSKHNLWVGTGGYGLFVRKAGKKDFINYTRNEGLPSNSVNFVTEDVAGNIFIGTEGGCAMWQKGGFNNVFTSNEPLLSFANENAYAFLDDGSLAFGTLDGVVILNTKSIKTAKPQGHKAVEPYITDILVNGQSIYDDGTVSSMSENSEGNFSHTQNNLTFYFSAFDYASRSITDFSYKLVGYDKDWSPASNLNFASYKNLKPGNYTFLVRYRIGGGDWITTNLKYSITIDSPWWATWWAYLIYIIVVAVAGYFIYRQLLTTYRLRRDIAVEKQLTDYKLRFFTDISHEFRTPLTLIQNSMDKLKAQKDIPGAMKQPLSNMQRDVDRMLRLINQLLEFRRMQNNKLSLSLQETDIVSFIYNIWISFHDIADNKRINYLFQPQVKELKMFIDRGFVDKIVYNLLSNAFKYTPAGGEVSVELGVRSEKLGVNGEQSELLTPNFSLLTIKVADTGIGIPEDKQQTMFERFATGKVSADSIGIGLHLTHELVRVHHGEITLAPTLKENSLPREGWGGIGCTFTVTLPLDKNVYAETDFMQVVTALDNNKEVEKAGFNEIHREVQNIEPMNDKTILIVDDTTELLEMLSVELSRYFHVETASDGVEAWEKLGVSAFADGQNAEELGVNKAQKELLTPHSTLLTNYALVISDVRMPRMDGFELTKKIRHDEKLRALPVILLTSLTDDKKQSTGLDAGADAYITKPFNVDVLISQCANLIKQREVLKAAYAKEPQQKPVLKQVIKEEKDLKFINRLDQAIQSNLKDTSLSVDTLAEIFSMGRTSFYNKVKTLTGKTPNEYINDRRLDRAVTLLQEGSKSVSEIAYETGYNTPQYFARNFKKKFGVTPSEYAKGE